MQITYEIIHVDPDLDLMEVRYSADGHAPVTVGMPLPRGDMTVEQRIAEYSPQPRWEYEALEPVVPEVGAAGVLA